MMTRAPIPPSQIAGALDFMNVLRLVASNPEEIQGRLQELADAQASHAARIDEIRELDATLSRQFADVEAAIAANNASIVSLAESRDAAAAAREQTILEIDGRIAEVVAAEEAIVAKTAAFEARAAEFDASCSARIEGIDRREAALVDAASKHAKSVEAELVELRSRKEAVAALEAAANALKAEYEGKLKKIQSLASTLEGGSQ